MNKVTIKDLIQDAGNTALLAREEKDLMRERVSAYMSYRPIRTTAHASTPAFSFRSALHAITVRSVPAFIIAGILLSGSGVSYAAEQSLPGDLLYPVKVDFNEEVVSWITADPIKRAVWEASRAERRLSEVSSLAKTGRLNAERVTVAAKQFAEQAGRAAEQVALLAKDDPFAAAEVSAEFESALEIHEVVLARLSLEGADDEAKTIASQVRGEAKKIAQLREDAESTIVSDDSSIATMSMAMEASDSTSDDSASEPVSDNDEKYVTAATRMRAAAERAYETLVKASGRVQNAEAVRITESVAKEIAEGDVLIDEHASEAYRLYRAALSRASRAARLFEAEAEFGLSFSVEEISGDIAASHSAEVGSSDADGIREDAEQQEAENAKEKAEWAIAELDAKAVHALESGERYEELELLLKQSQTYFVRGDIAYANGDFIDAARLYSRAYIKTGVNSGADSDDPLGVGEKPEIENVGALNGSIKRYYLDDALIISGVIKTPSACHAAEASAMVAESMPEQVTISIEWREIGGHCPQTSSEKHFLVSVPVSESAVISRIVIEGKPITDFTVEEITAENQSSEVSTETSTSATTSEEGTAESATSSSDRGMMERMGSMLKSMPGF